MSEKNHEANHILSVFGYTDFRSYLRDFYEFRKNSDRGYSYRAFAKAAGFSSPNVLKLAIEGQRNIAKESLTKFVKALRLSPTQATYFCAMVNMNQAKNDADRAKYYDEMQKAVPAAKRRLLDQSSYQYLSHWLFSVLREMVALPDFHDDPYWISRRLGGRTSVAEITDAWQFLRKEGFVEEISKGRWRAADNMVISSDEVRSLAIRNYHRQMVEQATDSLEGLAIDQREFGALTFTLPQEALAELKQKLKVFRQDLHRWSMEIGQDHQPDSVVQLNFQMFPHTRGGRN